MKMPMRRLLFWSPRILCLLFAAFLSVFALDVSAEGLVFWKTVLALLRQLISAWIILVASSSYLQSLRRIRQGLDRPPRFPTLDAGSLVSKHQSPSLGFKVARHSCA